MASKKTRNRAYWAAAKAITAGDDSAADMYRLILSNGAPDSLAVPIVESYEADYGRHLTHVDIRSARLWPARRIVDAIREDATA